jgi:phosphate starvation-inducible protein PhoH and related proteins
MSSIRLSLPPPSPIAGFTHERTCSGHGVSIAFAPFAWTSDTAMSETTITLDSRDEALLLFGSRDQYLREIRAQLGMQQLVGRGDQILLKGSDEQLDHAQRVFGQLRQMLRQQGSLSSEDVKTVLEVVLQGGERIGPPPDKGGESANRYVRPRTDGQARYVRAMREHDLTLCVGPAGTGKTFLAVSMAVSLLRQASVKKIVLVRPAVEAGERLGFLPGDMIAKVNPYLRPLFDALNDMMEPEQVKRYMENDIIEIVPLAFMRGRTLNQAVIILDEGQNTTVPQMKMFLTRMGNGSKIIVTGDVTQVDLPKQTRSGLIDAVHRLRDIERIAVIFLDEHDIVRNPLVQQILRAYEDERPRKKKE